MNKHALIYIIILIVGFTALYIQKEQQKRDFDKFINQQRTELLND